MAGEALKIRFELMTEQAFMPTRAHEDDAGIDFYLPKDYLYQRYLPMGSVRRFGLEIRASLPAGYCLVLKDRSSLAAKGLHVLGGVIDAGYRGEIGVLLISFSPADIELEPGMKICQGLLLPVPVVSLEQGKVDVKETRRGEGGFGSTDKKGGKK